MRRDARSVRTVGVALAAAVLFSVVPGAVFAEHHEKMAPAYSVIHYDDVGPANTEAYEENAKAWVAAFKKAGMGEEWSWRTYSGPNFNYAFLTDAPNYAFLDGADARSAAMVEAIGKETVDELSADGGGSSGHRHELTKKLPDLDYTPEGGVGEVGFVRLGVHSVKPGMGEDFKKLVVKVNEARTKVGASLAVRASQVEFGHGSYQFAVIAKDSATFHAARSVGAMLVEAFGPEEAQAIFDDWRGCITDYETSDWYFEPELSYMPGMHADKGMMDEKKEMNEGE